MSVGETAVNAAARQVALKTRHSVKRKKKKQKAEAGVVLTGLKIS